MTFVQDGRPLVLNARSLVTAQPRLTGRVVILVHGWCCSEEVWRFADGESTYATCLQRDTGSTPFAVRYNTGMPIADSGRDLARLLRALVAAYPRALDEIVLIGHSMGGLVIRAACQSGDPEDGAWTAKVRHVVLPRHPARRRRPRALRAGRHRRAAVGAESGDPAGGEPAPRARPRRARLEGRCGRRHRASPHEKRRRALATLPWLPSARHWLLVGTLTEDPRHPVTQALGDGLVRVPKGAAPGAAHATRRACPASSCCRASIICNSPTIPRCTRRSAAPAWVRPRPRTRRARPSA